jgi:hypothetical protein
MAAMGADGLGACAGSARAWASEVCSSHAGRWQNMQLVVLIAVPQGCMDAVAWSARGLLVVPADEVIALCCAVLCRAVASLLLQVPHLAV